MQGTAQILDCTIRDGSYVVDYQFTVEDTFIIAQGLAAAGIRRIEVGHGLGLNAQACGRGSAAISDVEYIHAARPAVPAGVLIGSFFIPGIGTEDSLRAAADAGLGFVRIGSDVDDFVKIEPFARLAKSLGLEVWGNLMKSYLLPPADFGEVCRRVGEFGVDAIGLVDSAGGMTPDDVAAFTSEAVARTAVPLGFHGHDNLTLAVANCLRFVECGGVHVDGSLSGLGRSGGNAATELLAALLTRRDQLAWPVDWERLVEFADAVMEFSVPEHARPRATATATGLNFFHSSFAPLVEKAAADARVPLFRTILRLPVNSRKKVTPEAAAAAAQLAAKESRSANRLASPAAVGESLERLQPGSLAVLAERLRVQKGKSVQRAIVTVAHTPGLPEPRIGPLRSGRGGIVAHVEVSSAEGLPEIQKMLTACTDFWALDKRFGTPANPRAAQPLFLYDDDAVVGQAVSDALQMLGARRVAMVGSDEGQRAAIARIAGIAAAGESVDTLIATDSATPAGRAELKQVRDGGLVLMIRANALTKEAFVQARERGLRLWRLDCGAALVAEVERLLHTFDRFHSAAGEREIAGGIHIVAGGVVGQPGDLVVDHLSRPRFLLGEADGFGGIRPLSEEARERSHKVQQWIVAESGL